MAQNIIILLTEGDHDAAFIYRILKANGFLKYSKAIKAFPPPLDKFLQHDVLEVSIPEVNLQTARTRFLPNNVVTQAGNEGNMILIYTLGGDGSVDKRKKLIDTFNALNTKDPNQYQVLEGVNISFLYFFDADDVGIEKRLKEINNELSQIFSGVKFEAISSNGNLQMIDDILIGAYIFAEKEQQIGKLEDVLIPMMQDGNEDVFEKAMSFLSIHKETRLYKDNIEFIDATQSNIKKVFGDKYHSKKSLIGSIGQLHKSGKSNTVCISDTYYLTDEKIKANEVCNEILAFIQKAII